MTVGTKLTAGFSAMAALTVTLGLYGFHVLSYLNALEDDLALRQAHKMELTGVLDGSVESLRSAHRGLLLWGDTEDFPRALAKTRKALDEFQPLAAGDREMQAVTKLQSGVSEWAALYAEARRLYVAGHTAEAQQLSRAKAMVLATGLSAAVAELHGGTVAAFAAGDAAADSYCGAARWVAGSLALLGVVAGVIGLFEVRGVSRWLRRASQDLSVSAAHVAGAAGQVADSGLELARGAAEQAASLQVTSATTSEMSVMARQNTESCRSAAGLAARSQERSAETDQSLQEMVVAMGEISSSSDKISRIIRVIDEIAFQTNILALNAAVEAARAGEAGMGFAVVADEVRNLAQRSALAAKDTASLIEESITRSKEGESKVHRVAKEIRTVTETAAQIRKLVDEVSSGSDQQAHGIEQMSQAIARMEQATHCTAASAEESAAAAGELNAQARALHEIVIKLNSMVGENSVASTVTKRPSVPCSERTAGLPALSRALASHSSARPQAPTARPDAEDAFPLDSDFSG